MTLERFVDSAARPAPFVHPETAPYWSGLADGELTIQRCSECQTARYPHAPVCFVCGSFEWNWTPAITARGSVTVVARVHRATGDHLWQAYVPFYSGLVEIQEGLRVPARILCECDAVSQPGTEVRAVTLEGPDGTVVLGFAHSCVSP